MEQLRSQNDLAVVTCVDRNMLAAGCCTLLSARDNLAEGAAFHLVALDLEAHDRAAIGRFCKRHGLRIRIHPFDSADLPEISKGRWSPAALVRLYLDRIGLPRVRRLLYLDADTLVLRALGLLGRIDLRGKLAAAVDDYIMPFPRKLAARRESLGLGPDSPYFNSGVILFDWPACLDADLLGHARAKLDERHPMYQALDQDALNAALEGKWLRLHPRWNAQTGFLPGIREPVIVHFTGRRKPWQKGAAWVHRAWSRQYARYLVGSDWAANGPETGLAGACGSLLLGLGKKIEMLPKAGRIRAFLQTGTKEWSGDER